MNKFEKKIFFIGAGPGNADLITRAGWNALSNSEVIFYDALIDFDSFFKASPKAKWINVGKRASKVSIEQDFIGRLLVNYSKKHKRIARLKGGDPSIFGRVAEEINEIRKYQIPYEIIPGVTAAFSAAADLSVSLSKRNVARSISFITPSVNPASTKKNNWVKTAINSDTVVFYMAGRERKKIAQELIKNGKNPFVPVAVIENASSKEGIKKISTLQDLSNVDDPILDGPVCLIIGHVLSDSHLHDNEVLKKLRQMTN